MGVLLLLLLLGAMTAGVVLGAVEVALPELLQALGLRQGGSQPLDASTKAIVVEAEVTTGIALAVLVGAALATAGTIFQALFRNPMADPYILGVSAGAALGASVAFCSR
jgi:iron complex transport system permease protein